MRWSIILSLLVLGAGARGSEPALRCSRFSISSPDGRPLPLQFMFELKAGGKELLCTGGPNGKKASGTIPCRAGAERGSIECFATSEYPGQAEVLAVKIAATSTDRENMGTVVTGFTAGGRGGFFIGAGGWPLHCAK